MADKPEQNWQPITMLPVVAEVVTGMLDGAADQEQLLYATWLASDGVPVNMVQKAMGHEHASPTLNRYTHTPDDYGARVLAAFDGSAAFLLPSAGPMEGEEGL